MAHEASEVYSGSCLKSLLTPGLNHRALPAVCEQKVLFVDWYKYRQGVLSQ